MISHKTLFCFGFGYVAKYLSDEFLKADSKVIGTKRQVDNALNDSQIKLIPYSDQTEIKGYLKQATHILISIPPDQSGDIAYRDFASLLQEERQHIEWIGYLSSTGVYGDYAGEWVNEETQPKSTSLRGKYRLIAEQQWQSLTNVPVHIFRLSGIYGPGRNPFERIISGQKSVVYKPGHFFSRTYIEDIIQVMMKSMYAQENGQIYNVADDCPATSYDVACYAHQLLKLDPPLKKTIDQANLTGMALEFYKDNKKVSNQKIKQDLGVKLICPDYKSGLDKLYNEYIVSDNRFKSSSDDNL